MAERNVSVVLSAKVGTFKADMAAAGKAARTAAQETETAWDKSNSRAGNAMKQVTRYSSELTTAGTAMATFGGVVVGSLGLAAKAAMSWESAWTGVLKTVDGTPRQLAKVEEGLRGLAKTLPSTHEEIAAVAEAAGQLGIKTGNVVSFTKTMIDMGESTNLSAEEAATGLARLSNIMGTSQNDFGKMGASIVGLGNNFATTEREIVEMSGRIAGVGKQAGLTEGDVFGLATALSSVGIDAEAGGTAISMVMKKIGNEVAGGGDKVAEFARIAGMSSAEFSAAWNEDAGGALDSFVQGLGRAQASGENVNGTLTTLGVTGIRESDALLRLSGAGDVLTNALKMGNDEYERGTALAMEAAKRYETAESKITIAGNSLKDTAITIGGTFLPAIADGAEAFASFADGIGKIPEPVLKIGAVLAGVVGAAALAGGAALILVPKIAETVTAFSALKVAAGDSSGVLGKLSGSKSSAVLRGIGKAAGLAAVGFVGAQLAGAAFNAMLDTTSRSSEEMINKLALLNEATNADTKGSLLDPGIWEEANGFWVKGIGTESIDSWGDALARSGDQATGWLDKMLNVRSDVSIINDTIAETDVALSSLADSGSFDKAVAGFKAIAEQSPDMMPADILDKFPQFRDHLASVATEAGMVADEATLVGLAMGTIAPPADAAAGAVGGVGSAADSAADGLQQMLEGLTALGLANLDERESMRQYESAIDAVTASIKENGTSLDITTEKGRNNQDALDGIADKGFAAAESMVKHGRSQEEVQGQLQNTYDDLVAAGKQFGLSGKKAENMAKEVMGIPKDVDVKTWMSNAAEEQAKKTKKAVDGIDKDVKIKVSFTVTEPENGIYNMPENLLNPNRNGKKNGGGKGPLRNPMGRYYGGIDIMPMADGGVHSNIAEMVKPNTWRVVGDRMDVDEAFIPLDGSQRSKSILMEAIKRMPGLGMARGGISSAERSVDSAQDALKAARRAKSDAKSKKAKAAAERRVRVAEDDLAAAKKSLKSAKDKAKADDKAAKVAADRAKKAREEAERKAKEERERRARVGELRSDLRTDVRRGSIRESVTSGLSGGYSQVDALAGLGANKDLSKASRSKANSGARKFEANLKALYSQAEKIDDKLKKAQDKATELKGIKDSVVSSLLGGRELDVGTFQTQTNGVWSSHSNLGQAAKGMRADVGAMKAFAGKLKKLTELGVPGSIIQEIAQAGVSEGSNMADSFIDATAAERKSYMGAWSDYEKYANQAGQYVTEGFQAGGASAADGVVKGLEGKKKNVEKAIANLAKAMESTFKSVLGIHSPSRVMAELGGFTAEGLVQGMLGGVADVQSAASLLGSASVPNMMAFAPADMSFDVSATPVVDDDQAMAGLAMQDMSNTTLESMALMQTAVADGFAAMVADTQAKQFSMTTAVSDQQAAMLLITQMQQAGMLTETQAKQAAMLLNTQTQYEAMRSTTEQKQTAQKTVMTDQQEAMRLMLIDKQSSMKTRSAEDFESLKNTTGSKFSAMRSATDTTMSGMYGDYDSRLGDLKGLNKRGFESILATSNKNMAGVRDGIDAQMRDAKPELGNRMNALIGVLSSFATSVNKAFGDVGVKLKSPAALKFATGGVMPGYTPGRDVHQFSSPTAGNLYLSGGEAIMRPEFTRAVGGEQGVKELNKAARRGGDNVHHMLGSQGFAAGGVYGPTPGVNAFADSGVWRNLWAITKDKFPNATLNSAYRGGAITASGNTSHHSRGNAIDVNPSMDIFNFWRGKYGSNLAELIYSPAGNKQIKNGHNYTYTGAVKSMHYNHVHIAALRALSDAMAGGLPGMGGEMSHPFLDRAKVKPGDDLEKSYGIAAQKLMAGIVGEHSKKLPDGIGRQLGAGIMSDASAGLVDKAKKFGKNAGAGDFGNVASGPLKQMAKQMLENGGMGDQFGDLDWLLKRESGWNPKAQNPSSSAYGLFQFLDSTWRSVGGTKTSDPKKQLEYGLKYIQQRYGDVRGARSFWERNHWYEQGAESAQSGWAIVGEDGPEAISLNGGETVKTSQETRKLLAENRTFIPNSGGNGFNAAALSDAMSAAIQSNGINANDLANALNGVKLTFQADGQQFTGAVTAVVGNGYDESRSRLSKSSQKIGAR